MCYQFVYNQVNSTSDSDFTRKLVGKLWSMLHKLMSLVRDPLVKATVWNSEMLLPFTHHLPRILKKYPQYSNNLLTIAKQVKNKYPSLTFIDIGANVGDTIALIRKEESIPVLAIEGDDYFFSILQKNAGRFKQVTLEKSFVGNPETAGKVVKAKGTAHLVQDFGEQGNFRMRSLIEIVKQYADFAASKLLKIDTDGFDGIIIMGAKEFLKSARPVVFFEYDPYYLAKQNDDGISIFSFLREAGYQRMIAYDNFGNYFRALDLANHKAIEEMHSEFTGFESKRYCDIAVFHFEDMDLFTELNEKEIATDHK